MKRGTGVERSEGRPDNLGHAGHYKSFLNVMKL